MDQRDHYVIVSILEEVRDFGERTFTAFGLPTDVPPTQGFSWRTFFDFYIEHVKCATRLGSKMEQFNWLERADKQCRAALRCMGNEVRRRIESATPATVTFGAILPPDAAPVCALREQQKALERLADFREQFDWLQNEAPAVVSAEELPRLSAARPSASKAGSSRLSRSPSPVRSPSPSRGAARPKSKVTFAASDSDDDAPTPKRLKGGKGKAPSDDGGRGGDGADSTPSHLWLKSQKSLFVSGKVWDIPATARSLKVAVGAKCWPVVLSRRTAQNKLSGCEKRGQPGHRGTADAAHVLGIDLRELEGREGLCRAPTDGERKRLAAIGLHRGRRGGGSRFGSRGLPGRLAPHPQSSIRCAWRPGCRRFLATPVRA